MTMVELLEFVGDRSVRTIDYLRLSSEDLHSEVTSSIRRSADGAPVYSYERWLRLRFSNAGPVSIADIQVWCPNLDPSSGWVIRIGSASNYQRPRKTRSSYALQLLPASVSSTAGFSSSLEGESYYSPYLVLQARILAATPGPIQSVPLDLRFSWSED